MKAHNWARRSQPVFAVAIAAMVAIAAQPAGAQSTAIAASPAADSQLVTRDSSATIGARIDTVRVKAKRRSWWRRESDLAAGNRFLAKELARYDRRILELEKKLDSLRLVAAARWKETRELEAAALATRDRRIEMERRVAMLEAADSLRARGAMAGQSPR